MNPACFFKKGHQTWTLFVAKKRKKEMSELLLQERRILPKYLFTNPTPEKGWYETVIAVYRIVHGKLYLVQPTRV